MIAGVVSEPEARTANYYYFIVVHGKVVTHSVIQFPPKMVEN